jgi:PAS domain S-box-containing protein
VNNMKDELQQKIEKLEQKNREYLLELTTLREKLDRLEGPQAATHSSANRIRVSGINMEWHTAKGTCTFENLPVAMMWVDTTLAGLMSGLQTMVGARRFALALQSEGRNSVAADWEVISRYPDFRDGFKAIANIAAVAGWGNWRLVSLDEKKPQCRFQAKDSWEGRYQKTLGVCWGSGMLAGKLAGYASRLFGTNCWADQTAFQCRGDEFDEFVVGPSERFIETEIENLLAADEATRADMAVALEKLRQEIAERQRAAKALGESEAKYRELVQNANSIILRFDTAGRITFFNEFAQRFFGYRENEIIGQNVVGTIVPLRESGGRDLDAIIADLIRDPDRYWRNENENVKRNGERVWIAWTNKAILGADGKVSQILCIGMDITQRKRSEEALRIEKEKFRLLVETSPLGVALIGKDATYKYINPRFSEIFGYTLKDVPTGKEWFEKAYPEAHYRRQSISAWVDDLSRSGPGEIRPRIFTVTCKDGTKKEINFQPVSQETEDQLVLYEDISERRRLEVQLRQAQKMEAIGTFAGGIAHDFNNILAAILGYTELALGKTPRETPLHQDLQEVFRSGLRARDLVKQILTFSRQAEQQLQPVQINLIVKEALRFLRSSLPASIEIRQSIAGNDRVLANPIQIHQVLMNLCANAKHAMRQTGGVLEVSLTKVRLDNDFAAAHREAVAGPYLKLTVTDSGEGMPAEVLEKIFEPFFTTKGKEEGTGLGLAVVHGIVRSCGGFITVDSEPGRGSTFNVFLPVIERRAKVQDAEKAPLPCGSERVLLVDDERLLTDIGKQMLERFGYRVTTRTSSVEALELFKVQPDQFDLVITDMTMPNMSGLELAAEIIGLRPEMPIILCTGFSEKITSAGAEAVGIRAFLLKPVALPDLLRAVRRILDKIN